eukprot:11130408-Alexandrium_andersonii.AAC.1
MAAESDDSDNPDVVVQVLEPAVVPEQAASIPKVPKFPISRTLFALGILAHVLHQPPPRTVHACEYFAGVKAITRAMNGMSYSCLSFEIKDAPDGSQDLCTRAGFERATTHVLSVVPGGFIWVAVVCSTWVFMSKSSTGRDKDVMGNPNQVCTLYANAMVQRVCMLLELATACGVHWIVERP